MATWSSQGDAGDRRAGRRRAGPARADRRRRPRAGRLGPGGARRAGRGGRPGPRPSPTSTAATAVWSDVAPRLYAQAAAGQWDPATPSTGTPPRAARRGRGAVVQVMTYLVENEQAALLVPARFLGRIHPHFREVIQLLAVQVADEARHIEVFTRRARLRRRRSASPAPAAGRRCRRCSTSRTSRLASFLLSVLGEGTFLSLLCVPRTARARPGDGRRSRSSPRRTRPATSPSASPTCASTLADRPEPCADRLRGRRRAPPRRAAPAPPASTDVSRRAGRARRRVVGAGGDRAGVGPRCRRSSARWTRAAGAGCVRLGFPTARRPSSRRCTPATSCEPAALATSPHLRMPRDDRIAFR